MANDAYEKACDSVTDTVLDETQKSNIKIIDDYENRILKSGSNPATKKISEKILTGIKELFTKAKVRILDSVKKTLTSPSIKAKKVDEIKDKARGSILRKLEEYKAEASVEKHSGKTQQNKKEATYE